ncbi:hypothetical protein [Iningainema tapete]|uniref:Uncharacterized protein n=1 Tax=Iningainema tapete BLCC-T55 TaxID=2748662 RepID=A0A8J7BXE0_9CYAN|nr:hypothetical protein [Iningainema tapete]MBD2773642.1 hypothetical protein [Iningainema tapete BLCC-T55]
MIICDLDYLESLPETYAQHINGGDALAISDFSANGYGDATDITTVIDNRAISDPAGRYHIATSYINIIAKFEKNFSVVSSSYALVTS